MFSLDMSDVIRGIQHFPKQVPMVTEYYALSSSPEFMDVVRNSVAYIMFHGFLKASISQAGSRLAIEFLQHQGGIQLK